MSALAVTQALSKTVGLFAVLSLYGLPITVSTKALTWRPKRLPDSQGDMHL